MNTPKAGKLLRIFVGENDKHAGMPLFEWIVRQAREDGLAGATVLRGLEGFGAHSRLHTAKILDDEEKINAFLPTVHEVVREGLATVERVEVHLYRSGDA
jgi:PII-like signaling protein